MEGTTWRGAPEFAPPKQNKPPTSERGRLGFCQIGHAGLVGGQDSDVFVFQTARAMISAADVVTPPLQALDPRHLLAVVEINSPT